MVTIVDASSEHPYGTTSDAIEAAMLARSHATWAEAGAPIAPPNKFGHVLVWLAAGFLGLTVLGMLSVFVGMAFPGPLMSWVSALVPAIGRFAGSDGSGVLFLGSFGIAFVSMLIAVGLGIKGQRMLREAPQLAKRARSARNIGRRRWLWGSAIAMVAVGGALFCVPFIPLFGSAEPAAAMPLDPAYLIGYALAFPGLGLIIWGFKRMGTAWQFGRASAAETQAADPRAPIVLLRSFRDDDLKIMRERTNAKGETETTFVRLEEAIADQFEAFGPLVAIGRPGEKMPTLGAARNYHSDAEWKAAVQSWIDKAQILLLVPGLTPGLGWELAEIERRGHIAKLLVLMPPNVGSAIEGLRQASVIGAAVGALSELATGTDIAEAKRANLQKRWSVLREAMHDVAAFASLPEAVPEGAIVLHLGRDLDPTVVVGPASAQEVDFERAIRLGIYGMFCKT